MGGLNLAHVPYWRVNNPILWDFCVSMIGRADIEGSKSNVAMNVWLPQASYPSTALSPSAFCLAEHKDPVLAKKILSFWEGARGSGRPEHPVKSVLFLLCPLKARQDPRQKLRRKHPRDGGFEPLHFWKTPGLKPEAQRLIQEATGPLLQEGGACKFGQRLWQARPAQEIPTAPR